MFAVWPRPQRQLPDVLPLTGIISLKACTSPAGPIISVIDSVLSVSYIKAVNAAEHDVVKRCTPSCKRRLYLDHTYGQNNGRHECIIRICTVHRAISNAAVLVLFGCIAKVTAVCIPTCLLYMARRVLLCLDFLAKQAKPLEHKPIFHPCVHKNTWRGASYIMPPPRLSSRPWAPPRRGAFELASTFSPLLHLFADHNTHILCSTELPTKIQKLQEVPLVVQAPHSGCHERG